MTVTYPATAGTLLVGEGPEGVAELIQLLDRHQALRAAAAAIGQLTDSGLAALMDEVAAIMHGLLDLDLGRLVLAGWQTHGQLVDAARTTRAASGTSEIVQLVRHTASSVHEPWIDILVHEVKVATLRIRLSVEFTVSGLAATVYDGALVALHGGSCTVTGTLSLDGRQLAERTVKTAPAAVVRLPRNGLPLLPRAANEAAVPDQAR